MSIIFTKIIYFYFEGGGQHGAVQDYASDTLRAAQRSAALCRAMLPCPALRCHSLLLLLLPNERTRQCTLWPAKNGISASPSPSPSCSGLLSPLPSSSWPLCRRTFPPSPCHSLQQLHSCAAPSPPSYKSPSTQIGHRISITDISSTRLESDRAHSVHESSDRRLLDMFA